MCLDRNATRIQGEGHDKPNQLRYFPKEHTAPSLRLREKGGFIRIGSRVLVQRSKPLNARDSIMVLSFAYPRSAGLWLCPRNPSWAAPLNPQFFFTSPVGSPKKHAFILGRSRLLSWAWVQGFAALDVGTRSMLAIRASWLCFAATLTPPLTSKPKPAIQEKKAIWLPRFLSG